MSIHIICQNMSHKSASKCSDFVLEGIADEIHDCNYITAKLISNLSKEDTVIFVYNEDVQFSQGNFTLDMKRLIEIEKCLDKKKVQVYNRPSKHMVLGCKYRFYSRFKFDTFIPKFDELTCEEDIDNIDYYPCIVTLTVRTLDNYRTLCNNKTDLIRAYNVLKDVKKSVRYERICVIKYIDSYDSVNDVYINVRLMVINNEILEYYPRPAEHWNVHTNDQTDDIEVHDKVNEEVDMYMLENRGEIRKILERCYRTLGNGFFEYNCIISKHGFYICEVGIKIYDDTVRKVYSLLNYSPNKFVTHERKYIDLVRYFLKTPRKKRKWSQKFLKKEDLYFDYHMTMDRKRNANKGKSQKTHKDNQEDNQEET